MLRVMLICLLLLVSASMAAGQLESRLQPGG